MRTAHSLRLRFLAALAASGALAGGALSACGGAVQTEGNGSSGASGASGSSGSSGAGSSSGASGTSSPTSSPPSPNPLPPPPPPPVVCEYGKPATECYTREQLEVQARHPSRGGDFGDAGDPDADVSMYFDSNGCLPAAMVRNSCCNPAVTGPTFTGSTCCYVHCAGACCGRPLLVDGEARVAAVRERSDWLHAASAKAVPPALPPASETRLAVASTFQLDDEARARIASAWTRDAAMEHASIAAFARFTLELLALGAPADIVLATQDATKDEVEHARDCFAIASRYAGRALGPGPLDLAGLAPSADLTAVTAAAIVEGCIGETLSALLAEARLARAEDDDVRSALRRIANEEARHAELAWRFVGWAVAEGGDPVRIAAARAFERALATPPAVFDASLRGVAPRTLRAHGLLDEAAAHETAARALAEVVAPCASALVGAIAAA